MSILSRVKRILRPLLIGSILVIVALFTVAMSAELDNMVKWQTGRDTRKLRELRLGTRSLGDIVAQAYRVDHWEAYHADELYRTNVNCYARDKSGNAVFLSWEVAHWFSPYPGIPRRSLFVTALSKQAAELTPNYAVPGLEPGQYPDTPATRSEALYGFASKNWISGRPPGSAAMSRSGRESSE